MARRNTLTEWLVTQEIVQFDVCSVSRGQLPIRDAAEHYAFHRLQRQNLLVVDGGDDRIQLRHE